MRVAKPIELNEDTERELRALAKGRLVQARLQQRAQVILLAADGLHPSSKGVRVQFDGPGRKVVDGPFAETKELIAGYWLWQVKSLEEAIEWVKRCPNPMPGPSEIEIRQVYEFEDFGDLVTPEHHERKARLTEQLGKQSTQPKS